MNFFLNTYQNIPEFKEFNTLYDCVFALNFGIKNNDIIIDNEYFLVFHYLVDHHRDDYKSLSFEILTPYPETDDYFYFYDSNTQNGLKSKVKKKFIVETSQIQTKLHSSLKFNSVIDLFNNINNQISTLHHLLLTHLNNKQIDYNLDETTEFRNNLQSYWEESKNKLMDNTLFKQQIIMVNKSILEKTISNIFVEQEIKKHNKI